MADLDEIDIRILDTLQKDGRISMLSLAGRVGLSPTPCGRRVKQLQDAGIIDRYTAVLNARKLGLGLDVYVEVYMVNKSDRTVASFEKAIMRMPEIVEAHFLTGETDYLLRVRVEDTDRFRDFLRERLLKISSVGRTVSCIALQEVKHTTTLSIPRAKTSSSHLRSV